MNIFKYIKSKILNLIKLIQINLMWKYKNNINTNDNNINDNEAEAGMNDTKIYIPFKDINENMLHNIEWIESGFGTFPYFYLVVDNKPYYLFCYNDITFKEDNVAKRYLGVNKPIDIIN